MKKPLAIPPQTEATALSQDRAETVLWHQGWLAAVVVATVSIGLGLGAMSWTAAIALLVGALPAAAGMLLRWRDTTQTRTLLVVMWAIGGSGACILSGGVSGPLAVWCLAPVAAATTLGPGRMVAEAAAVALIGAAVAALAQVAGIALATPEPAFGFWMGLTAQLTTTVGMASGMLLANRRAARRQGADGTTQGPYERLLTEQPHLIVSLDAEGRVGSAFGYAPEGISEDLLLGEGLLSAAEPVDRPALDLALQTARSGGKAETLFAPLGAPHLACSAVIRRAANGGLVAVLGDASAQKARETTLEAAKRAAEQLNSGKSKFLANMSHELRTPLNAIMGFSDMMRARLFGPMGGKYGEYAELIHESGGHLLDLINDLLDMSKIEADRYELDREVFDAREPVSAALRLLRVQADDAGVILRGVLPPRELEIDADRRAIKQIVLNLVSNALKFTPRSGQVTVTLNGYGDRIELVVADTGVGIAEEDLQRLGRPYEQAGSADQKAKGSGLGLSLVRALAELHGGEMTMESALGEGTSVTVRLPSETAARMPGNVISFTPSAAKVSPTLN